MPRFKFSIHPLYLLLGLLLTAIGEGYMFVVYSVVLILHEMGHSVAAEKTGYCLDEIVLMPYGAVLKGETTGAIRPRADIIIALAGPLTNIICSILFFALWWLLPATYFFTEAFALAGMVNALFNLLPIFPLDGGRILLAVLRQRMPVEKAVRRARTISIIFASCFCAMSIAALAVSRNISYAIIGAFIFSSSIVKSNSGTYNAITAPSLEAVMRGIEKKEFIISEDSRLIDGMRLLSREYCLTLLITAPSGEITARIDEPTLRRFLTSYPAATPLKEVLKNQSKNPSMPLSVAK